MQRPVAVAAHERDRQQIEEPAQVPLEPVAGATVLPRPVIHRELRDAVPLLVGEDGDEPVQLSVEHEAAHDLCPVRLEAAVHVVPPQTGHPAGDPVEELRRDAARERVSAPRLPAGDEIEALLQLREQARDLGRIVLQVAVDRDDELARRLREARRERGGLAEVAAQPHHAHVVLARVQSRQRAERLVRRAVVDVDGLPLLAERVERRLQLFMQQRDAALFVVEGDDDRDHGPSMRSPWRRCSLSRRPGSRSGRACSLCPPRRCRWQLPPAASLPTTRAPRSTSPRSRARPWTVLPCGRRTRRDGSRSSSASPPEVPRRVGLRPASRWRSPLVASCPTAPTPLFPSSLLSKWTTRSRPNSAPSPARTCGLAAATDRK